MSSDELSVLEMERQDLVDNEIYDLICALSPFESNKVIQWDIEVIGEIRDALSNYYESVAMAQGLEFDAKKFYPWIEWTDEEKEILNGGNND